MGMGICTMTEAIRDDGGTKFVRVGNGEFNLFNWIKLMKRGKRVIDCEFKSPFSSLFGGIELFSLQLAGFP